MFGSLNKLCFPSVAEVTELVQSLRRAEMSVVRLGMCYRNLNCLIQTTNEGTQTSFVRSIPITGSFFIPYEIKVKIECIVHLCIYDLLTLYLLISFHILSTTYDIVRIYLFKFQYISSMCVTNIFQFHRYMFLTPIRKPIKRLAVR